MQDLTKYIHMNCLFICVLRHSHEIIKVNVKDMPKTCWR